MTNTATTAPAFAQAQRELQSVCSALDAVIIGQRDAVETIVTAVFAGGHVLMEGLPGLGKTHLAKALSATLSISAMVSRSLWPLRSAMPYSVTMMSRSARGTVALA